MNQQIILNKLQEAIDNRVIPGASIAFLTHEQSTTYFLGRTTFSPESPKLDESFQYDLASLSKVIGTTTRILQLIDQQQLNFSTRVKDILPNCESNCTIEELLCHSAGYPSDIENKYECTKEMLLQQILSMSPQLNGVHYSDIGYILLGLIIQQVDQMSLEDSFQQYIFKPLKMRQTTFKPHSIERCVPTEYNKIRGMIQGQIHDHKAYILGQSGSAGLFSTLNDLVLFSKAYLKQSSTLFSSTIFHYLRTMEKENRTLGWEKKYGNTILYHTGFTGTSLLMDIEKKEAMILLTNRIHPSRVDRGFISLREEINQIFLNK